MSEGIKITAIPHGRHSKKYTVTADNGSPIHVDTIIPTSADDRQKFATKVYAMASGAEVGSVEKELLKVAAEAARREAVELQAPKPDSPDSLPAVLLPGGGTQIQKTGLTLGQLLAGTSGHYIRGGVLVTVIPDEKNAESMILEPVTHASLASLFESVATLQKVAKDGDIIPAVCNEATAKLIAHNKVFQAAIPHIVMLSNCPVLAERAGKLIEIAGYDRESGILAFGKKTERMDLDAAKQVLEPVLRDFNFATSSDRSRAFAALITPALIQGGLLRGRAPIDLGEADASQSGKGYRNKLTAAVYRAVVHSVTQKKAMGGVGSMEEAFNDKLIKGYNFIALDNVRGTIDSPAIESFMTEDNYSARVPYLGNVDIDPYRIVILITSNKAEITVDLGNRSSCTRIIKRPQIFQFTKYPEGDILDHIRIHQPRFLGAVFTLVEAWYAAGCLQTGENRHDFRQWARSLDWIVQNLLGQEPLLDGQKETQARMTNPSLNWLRDVGLAVKRANRMETVFQAHDILNLLERDGQVEIPGVAANTDLSGDQARLSAFQAIGKKMAKCFSGGVVAETVIIDGMFISRFPGIDKEKQREIKQYLFSENPDSAVSPDARPARMPHQGENSPPPSSGNKE